MVIASKYRLITVPVGRYAIMDFVTVVPVGRATDSIGADRGGRAKQELALARLVAAWNQAIEELQDEARVACDSYRERQGQIALWWGPVEESSRAISQLP